MLEKISQGRTTKSYPDPIKEGKDSLLPHSDQQILPVKLLGRKITFITLEEMIKLIRATCKENQKILVAHSNVHGFNLSFHLPWFHEFLNNADIVYCDGFGVLKAATYCLGLNLSPDYRVAGGTDLVPALLKHTDEFSFFLLGTRPDILNQALQQLKADIPGIRVSGHHGYFDQSDLAQNNLVVEKINLMKPNILIVGMGMPLQEEWLYKNMHRLNVNVLIPCGAAIDRLAGVVSDCPPWLSELGLEWLYRLAKEPRRLATRYLIGNLAFVLQIVLAKKMKSGNFDSPQCYLDK